LIFKVILNGCSTRAAEQAAELNAFVGAHLSSGGHDGGTVLFVPAQAPAREMLAMAPTASATLVRVARYQPENFLAALQTLEGGSNADLYLFPSSHAGSEMAVRWAFRQKGSSLVQVQSIKPDPEGLTAAKAVYADHVMGTFRLRRKPYCISPARGSAGRRTPAAGGTQIDAEYDLTGLAADAFVKKVREQPETAVPKLETARFVVVGGMGMGGREKAARLQHIAAALGAEFGVSRPAAMNAWAALDKLVGVSGTMTSADVCIAAGVSGAAALYAGIENCGFVAAINTDPRAPIVKGADAAVIDDCNAVMEALLQLVEPKKDGR